MTIALPTPGQVRAIIVGIERYPGLGSAFDIPGAAIGALAFAKWLVHERSVPAAGIDLWLSLADGTKPEIACASAELAGATVHAFDWAAFRNAMAQPQGNLANGQFLMVYFCGHGVVSGPRQDQHLVLPDATESQFQCFEAQNWRALFRGSGWQQYGYQLWILDACRNKWSSGLTVLADQWNPGIPSDVRQCAMYACSTGGAAGIDSRAGPLFTRCLIEMLHDPVINPPRWPAFDKAFQRTAEMLRTDPRAAQNPTLSIGEDWYGAPLSGAGLVGLSLPQLLTDLLADFNRTYQNCFKRHVMGAQSLSAVGFPEPPDLDRALELLHALPPVSRVPPIVDFAERVVREVKSSEPAKSDKLHAWVRAQLSNQAWAELDARFAANPGSVVLALWYHHQSVPPCIDAELTVLNVGRGIRPWGRPKAKPVKAGMLGETIGDWISAVHTHTGDPLVNIVVELYLPREMLPSTAFDTATVPINGEMWRLGKDVVAFLRCTDRYKGALKRKRWHTNAAIILPRLNQPQVTPLQLALSTDTPPILMSAFLANTNVAPVWLGFESAVCGDAPLSIAIDEGLPAVVWLRADDGVPPMEALREGLQDLLKSPLKELPDRLRHWRTVIAGSSGNALSLLLDDPAREPALFTQMSQPGE